MTDFSVPHRMSPGVFPIMLVNIMKRFGSLFIILILAKAFDSDTSLTDSDLWLRALVTIGAAIAIVLILTCLSYFPKKFYVSQGNLIFIHGLIRRETTTIPLHRIHTLRTRRGVMYRLLGMRGITFDTLASKGEEIELILDESDWQSLMNLIEKEEATQSEPDNDTPAAATDTMRFDDSNLILDALCQNHLKGAAVLGTTVLFILDRLSDFSDNAVETIANYTSSYAERFLVSPLMITILLVMVYAIILSLWLGKVLLRYYNMTLIRTKALLTFNYGLLSRASCRFAFDKVCTIWVKRNYLERRFGLGTLMLKQALNASSPDKEVGDLKIYGRDTSATFLEWWLRNDYTDAPDILTAASGKGAMFRIIVPAAVISVLASIILCYNGLYAWVALPAIYLLYAIVNGILTMRRSKITLKDSYLIVDNGHYADVRNYLKYDNIEVVRIKATPFTPIFHRVTLALSTAGTTFYVRSLKENEAKFIYELTLLKTETQI